MLYAEPLRREFLDYKKTGSQSTQSRGHGLAGSADRRWKPSYNPHYKSKDNA
jgi:hypothetical protein